ncbi:hypothetical protein [Actinophytocola sp.]|uniref:hypothetical protein n=1 Tax=Actinophytocola sp. TaxID=1872138 RepID=UPI003D6C1710
MRGRIDMTMDTRLGELTLVADHGELTGIYFPYQRSRADLATFGERSDPGFEEITRQLAAVETSRSVTSATLPSPAVVTEPEHIVITAGEGRAAVLPG